MIGRNIGGRYQILSSIGEGGMSVVYKAKDLLLGRLVAVKVLREQFTSDDDFIKRFRREAQSAASLSHVNIVGIYDVGQDGNLYYLVMEYIEGENLKEIIKERGVIPQEETIYIVKQICDALEHAHSNDLVHRDIKPHNILISKEGLTKVTDFGIARAVSAATVTHTRSILGSVHYFSPEQARGEVAGHKSDIYSLGILLYEMVTGKLPFEGDSPIGIALQHIQNSPIKPSEINPDISLDLENVILKCIAKDSANRYEDFLSIKNDLQDIHEGIPLNIEVKENKAYEPSTLDDTIIYQEGEVVEELEEAEIEEVTELAELKEVEEEKINPCKKLLNKARKLTPKGIALVVLIAFLLVMLAGWTFAKIFIKTEVVVPDVSNLTVAEAEKLLKDNKLNMEVQKKIESPEVDEGKVISQDPLPDVVVKSKRTVLVIVSKGIPSVTVADVIGYTEVEAEIKLFNKNLDIGEVTYEYSDEYPKGRVINQYPSAKEEVEANSEVDLVISKGSRPNYKSMTTLIGLDLNSAKARIKEQGLTLNNVSKRPSNEYEENVVIGQSPSVGNRVTGGTKVNLIVSSGSDSASNSDSDSENNPQQSKTKVSIKLSRAGNFIIEVSDDNGERQVYNAQHQKDDFISQDISYTGKARITGYLDDEIILQKNEP